MCWDKLLFWTRHTASDRHPPNENTKTPEKVRERGRQVQADTSPWMSQPLIQTPIVPPQSAAPAATPTSQRRHKTLRQKPSPGQLQRNLTNNNNNVVERDRDKPPVQQKPAQPHVREEDAGLQNDLNTGAFKAHNLMNKPPPKAKEHAKRRKMSKPKVEHTISISAHQPEDSDSDINIMKTEKRPQIRRQHTRKKATAPKPKPVSSAAKSSAEQSAPASIASLPASTPVQRSLIMAPGGQKTDRMDVTQQTSVSQKAAKKHKKKDKSKTPKDKQEPKSDATTGASAHSKKSQTVFGSDSGYGEQRTTSEKKPFSIKDKEKSEIKSENKNSGESAFDTAEADTPDDDENS